MADDANFLNEQEVRRVNLVECLIEDHPHVPVPPSVCVNHWSEQQLRNYFEQAPERCEVRRRLIRKKMGFVLFVLFKMLREIIREAHQALNSWLQTCCTRSTSTNSLKWEVCWFIHVRPSMWTRLESRITQCSFLKSSWHLHELHWFSEMGSDSLMVWGC